MKNYLLLLFIIAFSYNTAVSQNCNQGLSPNTGFRGQTLTTTITNNSLFFGNGSAPCSPSDVYLHQQSSGTTINASTLTINNDSVRVSWNIPTNAPSGGYDLYLSEYVYSTVNGNCVIGPMQCITPQAFGIGVSLITGSVYYDDNLDTVFNGNDILLPNQKLMILPDSIITFTDANGNYTFFADSGTHTIRIISNDFYAVSSDSIVVNVSGQNVTNQDFAMYPNSSAFNTNGWLYGRARCNTLQSYTFYYNSSTIIPVNLVIKFFTSSNVFMSGSTIPPDSVNGDTTYYSIFNLMYNSGFIGFDLNIPSAGSQISVNGIIETYDLNSNLVEVDSILLNQTVSCSFDPNDKSVSPEGVSAQHYTLFGDTLFYTIRFQNTGNDTAYSIHILDTLDSDLDINSFRLVGSSHPVIVELMNGGIVDFHFYNIMLPDSNVDEPGSNGSVSYTISALQSLPELTPVNNTAYIYFDQNLPVMTNQTENMLVSNLTIGIVENEKNNSILFYPNPFTTAVTVSQADNSELNGRIVVTDILGNKVLDRNLEGQRSVIDMHQLSPGVYLYRITDEKNKILSGGRVIRQ